jgi:hypothetical protein
VEGRESFFQPISRSMVHVRSWSIATEMDGSPHVCFSPVSDHRADILRRSGWCQEAIIARLHDGRGSNGANRPLAATLALKPANNVAGIEGSARSIDGKTQD